MLIVQCSHLLTYCQLNLGGIAVVMFGFVGNSLIWCHL